MKNIKFETNLDLYGYWDHNKKIFIPYWDKNCKHINAIYGKDTKKVYSI